MAKTEQSASKQSGTKGSGAKSAGAKAGEPRGVFAFFRASWAELKKVHHPSRQETMAMTWRVFAMVGMFALFLGLTDWLVGSLMKIILT